MTDEPTPEQNAALLEEAIFASMDDFAQHLVDSYVDVTTGKWENVGGPEAGLAAAILAALAVRKVEQHSRDLVRLTWVLLGTTVVLAALTAVLLWRTAL